MAFSTGGMLANTGANVGRQVGGAYGQFGRDMGGMMTGALQGFRERRGANKAQELLKQFKDNPAQLNALGQKYATEGNDALSKVFFDAAKAATATKEKQVASLEASGQQATKQAQKARAVQVARQKGNADALVALRSGALDPAEYLKSLVKKPEEPKKPKYDISEQTILKDGEAIRFQIATNREDPTDITMTPLGKAPPRKTEEKTEERGRWDWSVNEQKEYTKAAEDAREAEATSVELQTLLDESKAIAEESAGPFGVGGIIGKTKDFLISDVAGLGDQVTIHRRKLGSIRMQNAIDLLPRGPASDKDVALALDGSVDPRDLSEKERLEYLSGMVKLAKAEQEYYEGKLRWIEATGDPLAFGYEKQAKVTGLNKKIDALRNDNPAETNVIDGELAQVKLLAQRGEKEAALQLLEVIKKNDETGYVALLDFQAQAQKNLETFVEKNNIELF